MKETEQQTRHRNNNTDRNSHQGLGHETSKNLTSDSPVDSTKELCCECDRSSGLHHFNCLPSHLQFNRFVRTGYRVNLSTWECLKSLLYFHNESFNIYSHGLATVLLIYCGPYIYGKMISNQSYFYMYLYSIHHITCITCLLFSAIYHLMMCHENGCGIYNKLLTLDWLGIWTVTTFGPIASIKATLFCFPELYKMVISVYLLLAYISLLYVVRGRSPKEKIQILTYFGFIKLGLYALRGYLAWSGYITAKFEAVWFLLAMELCGFFGGLMNVARIPERWISGKFDFVCNSHNIMHVIVLICPVLLHCGTVLDIEWMKSATCLTGVDWQYQDEYNMYNS